MDQEYHKEYSRQWYKKNRDKHLAMTKARRDELRAELATMKSSQGCRHCGWNVHPSGLDFHHPAGDKDFTISVSIQKPKDLVLAEAAKCSVLCSNCHRLFHAGIIVL